MFVVKRLWVCIARGFSYQQQVETFDYVWKFNHMRSTSGFALPSVPRLNSLMILKKIFHPKTEGNIFLIIDHLKLIKKMRTFKRFSRKKWVVRLTHRKFHSGFVKSFGSRKIQAISIQMFSFKNVFTIALFRLFFRKYKNLFPLSVPFRRFAWRIENFF